MVGLYELEEIFDEIMMAAEGFSMLFSLAAIVIFLSKYFVEGYALMCTGHKAKVEGDLHSLCTH